MPKTPTASTSSDLGISWWKKGLLLAFVVFFALTSLQYLQHEIREQGAWLWPMLFVPLILYLLGVFYGEVPARFLKIDALRPFPVPFARQYDRCVLAVIVLFTGLFLNLLLLAAALVVSDSLFLKGLYCLYLALMLYELPNSLRIFRFIQHVNTMQYVNVINPTIFKPATDYYQDAYDQYRGEARQGLLADIYQSVEEEAASLVQKESPISAGQQIALNLAVRSGEAIRRCRLAAREGDSLRLRANLLLLESFEKFGNLQLPDDLERIRERESKAGPSALATKSNHPGPQPD